MDKYCKVGNIYGIRVIDSRDADVAIVSFELWIIAPDFLSRRDNPGCWCVGGYHQSLKEIQLLCIQMQLVNNNIPGRIAFAKCE